MTRSDNAKIGKSFRLSEKEIKTFEAAAEKLGFSFSDYVRRACYLLNDLSFLLLHGSPDKNTKIILDIIKRNETIFSSILDHENK